MGIRAKLTHKGISETRRLLTNVCCLLEEPVAELLENVETIEADVGTDVPSEFQSLLDRYRMAVDALHEARTKTMNILAETAGDNVLEDT
ncbi:MAG: hypothetical protein OXJ54_17030 [Gemmatimonadetes bacterium]|nr:hypothetical protein [Candidatus Palauibacter rhopaloidicola]